MPAPRVRAAAAAMAAMLSLTTIFAADAAAQKPRKALSLVPATALKVMPISGSTTPIPPGSQSAPFQPAGFSATSGGITATQRLTGTATITIQPTQGAGNLDYNLCYRSVSSNTWKPMNGQMQFYIAQTTSLTVHGSAVPGVAGATFKTFKYCPASPGSFGSIPAGSPAGQK